MKIIPITLTLITLFYLNSCASSSKTISVSTLGETEKSDDSNEDEPSGDLSPNNKILTYSLTNNSLTSLKINNGEAKRLEDKFGAMLKNPSSKQKRELVTYMALKRLSGADLRSVFAVAKFIILNELKLDIRRKLPESAMLELALISIQQKSFSMADHWLNEISNSKNRKILASASTARGMIELLSNRLPEAVFYWNQALKYFRDFKPARFNLGFFALKYGDYRTAKEMLSGFENDWFALTGVMQAERLSNNPRKVKSLCDRIIGMKKKYKPALLSCALNTFHGFQDLAKAKEELKQVAGIDGPPSIVDEKAFLNIGRIDNLTKSSAK